MKKKLLMLLLPAVMLFNLFIFVACNNDNPEGPEVTEPEKSPTKICTRTKQ